MVTVQVAIIGASRFLASPNLFRNFNPRGVGAIAQSYDCGNVEERLDSERRPYPAAEERDEDCYEALDGDPRRDRRPHFVADV